MALAFFAGILVLFAIAAARHSGGMTSLGPAFSPLSGKSPVVQIAGIVMSAVACLILRIESGEMELEPAPINLGDVLAEVEGMFATQMSVKKLQFATDSSGLREPRVLCDKNRLNRVLLNLVSNAYKFTPEGGRIDVTATQTGEDDPDAGVYELRVKGSGIGMSKEFAAHVFEPFGRERTSTVSGIQGTGLGMAITKSIVELMKGTIRVETGRRPEMAERGSDAFDLVLTDMFMPKTTGEELVAAIRADARFDSLPVFLFTADVEFKEGFAEKGFDGVLIKPATLESLGEMLAQRAIRAKK